MPRFRETIPVDDYVLDVLMRDLVGHDRQPAAYLVYLYLYGQAARDKWKPVAKSYATWRMRPAFRRALSRPRSRTCAVANSSTREAITPPPLRTIASCAIGENDV